MYVCMGQHGSFIEYTVCYTSIRTHTHFQRFGFTIVCPDNIAVPSGALDLYRSADYWILSASTVHHNGQERRVDFNLESLGVGQSVGCMVNKEGELRYFLDGVDQGVAWSGVTTDKPLWGFADIYGLARKIKSDFLFGKSPPLYSAVVSQLVLQCLVVSPTKCNPLYLKSVYINNSWMVSLTVYEGYTDMSAGMIEM